MTSMYDQESAKNILIDYINLWDENQKLKEKHQKALELIEELIDKIYELDIYDWNKKDIEAFKEKLRFLSND